jgi:hypothetical protein
MPADEGGADHAKTLARLRDLLAKTKTFRECATRLKKPQTTLFRLAVRHELPHRRRRMLATTRDEMVRRIEHGVESYAAIARFLKLAKSTVSRAARRLREGRLDADEDLAFAPRRVAPYECSGCLRTVVYRPCVICRAGGETRPTSAGRSSSEVLDDGRAGRV